MTNRFEFLYFFLLRLMKEMIESESSLPVKQNLWKGKNMKNTKNFKENEDFEIPTFDFENSIPNKYAKLYTEDNKTIIESTLKRSISVILSEAKNPEAT